MKIFIQSAVILAVLLGSGLSQAATTTASIPMGVDVPKSCTFSNVSAGIIVPEDGTKATRDIRKKVKSYINLFPISGYEESFNSFSRHGYGNFYGIPVNGFFEVALQNPITAITEAGVYTDTLNMNVSY